ncbi:MAG: pyridoxal-phosphate dependent enzyme, partial [Pseudonocardiaceae bacterium]
STPLGAVGFAVAAAELAAQLDRSAPGGPALVVLAVGSGASCAGLLAAGPPWPVLGVSVSRSLPEITGKVHELAHGCARLLGTPPPRDGRLEIVDARGPGFGVASPADRAAARLALHTEGLLLDHTYSAKAFAVLTQRVRSVAGPVVFWHTGGLLPAVTALGGRI